MSPSMLRVREREPEATKPYISNSYALFEPRAATPRTPNPKAQSLKPKP